MGRSGNEKHINVTLLHILAKSPLDVTPGLKTCSVLTGDLSFRLLATQHRQGSKGTLDSPSEIKSRI